MSHIYKQNWIISAEDHERCIQLAQYLVEHRSTVRATAHFFGISKSTVHKDLTEKLSHIHPQLYEAAKQIMEQNKAERHIRGGKATQDKYQKIRREREETTFNRGKR